MVFFKKKPLSFIKPKLLSAGYRENKSGVYDLRDIESIHNWKREIVKM